MLKLLEVNGAFVVLRPWFVLRLSVGWWISVEELDIQSKGDAIKK